jgi:hypothetical protein
VFVDACNMSQSINAAAVTPGLVSLSQSHGQRAIKSKGNNAIALIMCNRFVEL